jgi:hypothetical protein
MILELFALLFAVSLFLIILGFSEEDKAYKTIGFFFIFLLSLIILNGALEYKTGSIVNTVNASVTNVVYTYNTYSDQSSHWVGWLLAVASSFAMIFSWMFPNKNARSGARG